MTKNENPVKVTCSANAGRRSSKPQ